MGITDFVPLDYLSEFFKIPLMVIIPIIFITGYITLKIARKYILTSHSLSSIDDVFILSISGLIWFLRISLFYIIIKAVKEISDNPAISDTIKENAQGNLNYFTIILIFVSIADIAFLKGSHPYRKYSVEKRKYKFTKKISSAWNKYSPLIMFVVFFIFSLFLSYPAIAQGSEYYELSIPYSIFISISLTPLVSGLIKIVGKLTEISSVGKNSN